MGMIWVGILSVLCLLGAPHVSAEDNQTAGKRMIIGFEDSVDEALLEDMDIKRHHTYEELNAVSVTLTNSQADQLRSNSNVAWAENDQKVQTSKQKIGWGYNTLDVSQSTEWDLTGEGTDIAIIDTGIDADHPDLKVEGGINLVEKGDSWDDDNGHGTHVAGVIGAQHNNIGTLGVAPKANLYAAKALDEEGDGWEGEIIAAVDWAIEEEMDIINLSLTSCQSSTGMKTVLDRAEEEGITVVAASGNGILCDGEYLDDVMYPARYSNVASVGAVDRDQSRAVFSYGGDSLDFTAPGTQIYSTYITTEDHPDGYKSMNGTSMAAPYVSGVFALLKQAYPHDSAKKLENRMINHTIDLGEDGKDFDYGHGLVQAPKHPFSDIKPKAWYYPHVRDLYNQDIVNGFANGTYKPLGDITREQVVTMIGRALGLDGEKRDTPFPDVDEDAFSSGYITSAVEAGIIEGHPDGSFGPKQKIKRQDVAVIIHRAFDFNPDTKKTFSDVNKGRYYYDAVTTLAGAGVINGYPSGLFEPNQDILRAELSGVLAKGLAKSNQ
nr:S8 family serine peptidase [Thalassobacillus sp. CUG 92003]